MHLAFYILQKLEVICSTFAGIKQSAHCNCTSTRLYYWSKALKKVGGMTDAVRLQATVYVGGLDSAVNERVLLDAFAPFGEVIEVSLPKPDLPSSTDPHRGFGYVEFEDAEDAKEAIDNMDLSELFGRVIKVAAAKPQKSSDEGLGSKTAIWEQVVFLRAGSKAVLELYTD